MNFDDKQVWYTLLLTLSGYGIKKVPKNFKTQCKAIKDVISNDETGLIFSTLNYAVNSASNVEYKIEVENENLERILNVWLSQINIDYIGKIPVGIKELSKEYFKERWMGSSLCILKVIWAEKNGIILPEIMYFIDGSCVDVKIIDDGLNTFQYYMDEELLKDIFVQKPYSRWYDQYSVPYLIKTGILRNYYSIITLKEKSDEVIGKILPYLMFLKKGTERLAIEGRQALNDNDLKALSENFKTFLSEYKSKINDVPIYTAPFDTEISHIIPELKNILNVDIYTENIRAILSGLGLIQIDNSLFAGQSRREAIINPKPYIEEINSGIEDFKRLLQEVIYKIIDKNKLIHKKYFSDVNKIKIVNSPLKINVHQILDQIRMAYIYGVVSLETYCEILGLDFERERDRRTQEHKEGLDLIFYPHRIQNPPMKKEEMPPVTKKEEEKNTEKLEGGMQND